MFGETVAFVRVPKCCAVALGLKIYIKDYLFDPWVIPLLEQYIQYTQFRPADDYMIMPLPVSDGTICLKWFSVRFITHEGYTAVKKAHLSLFRYTCGSDKQTHSRVTELPYSAHCVRGYVLASMCVLHIHPHIRGNQTNSKQQEKRKQLRNTTKYVCYFLKYCCPVTLLISEMT